jgi:asparaginyl-tRNA synthetase
VSDGSCFAPLQIVAPATLPNYADEVQKLSAGCAIVARGKLVPSQGKGQAFELQADAVEVLGFVEDPETYPIQPKQHSPEFLREVAHLRPRTNLFGAISRVRHTMMTALHRHLTAEGFYWVNTPIITTSDAEGAGDMFRVSTLDLANLPRDDKGAIDFKHDFFAREAFLTVSGQLNVEAYCLALSKVYTVGPTFRAENSNTSRHAAEFWMIEPEVAFCDLTGNMDLAEAFVKHLIRDAREHCAADLEFFSKFVDKDLLTRLDFVLDRPFQRCSYTEAVAILEKSGRTWEHPVSWGANLQAEHERYLTEEHFKCPVTVYNYPRAIKAFYMRQNGETNGRETVAAMDLLVPGIGEIIGGSQREERLDQLRAGMALHHLDEKAYWWYLDLRRYGSVPHAGFGLGFERMLMFVTGVGNIRDVIPFARTPGTADF